MDIINKEEVLQERDKNYEYGNKPSGAKYAYGHGVWVQRDDHEGFMTTDIRMIHKSHLGDYVYKVDFSNFWKPESEIETDLDMAKKRWEKSQ